MSKKKFKEKKQKKQKETHTSLFRQVLNLFDENPGRVYDFKQIARKAGAKNKALNQDLFSILENLEESGKIRQLPHGGYTSTRKTDTITGVVDHVNVRFAYIATGQEGSKDIYVRTQDQIGRAHV